MIYRWIKRALNGKLHWKSQGSASWCCQSLKGHPWPKDLTHQIFGFGFQPPCAQQPVEMPRLLHRPQGPQGDEAPERAEGDDAKGKSQAKPTAHEAKGQQAET